MNQDELLHELEKGAVAGAKALLGRKLVHITPKGRVAGYIVEVEAYVQEDPASHTYNGRTLRNASMFEAAGTIYVYFTYGMHYCVNIVTGPKGHGEGVLIRALEPIEGVDIMEANRQKSGIGLTNGPAKLVEALGITRELNGQKIGGELLIEKGLEVKKSDIQTAPRIGISKAVEELARFYIKGNSYVSRLS
jgi:DNA-3-methyladenine glycosylase